MLTWVSCFSDVSFAIDSKITEGFPQTGGGGGGGGNGCDNGGGGGDGLGGWGWGDGGADPLSVDEGDSGRIVFVPEAMDMVSCFVGDLITKDTDGFNGRAGGSVGGTTDFKRKDDIVGLEVGGGGIGDENEWEEIDEKDKEEFILDESMDKLGLSVFSVVYDGWSLDWL